MSELIHLIIVGVCVSGMRRILLPNGVRNQNSVWHPMAFLQGNGSAPSLVRIRTFRRRKFHGGELKKPEVKAAWEAVDTLAKKSICLRRTFQTGETKGKNANRKSGKKIVEATAYVCGLGFYEFL